MADPILQNFVDGRYADTVEGRTASLIDPGTGEVFAEAPLSGEADVDAAVQAAARAFEAWRDTTPSERSLALLRVADAVEARADALVAAEEPEHGQAAPADPSKEIGRCPTAASGTPAMARTCLCTDWRTTPASST